MCLLWNSHSWRSVFKMPVQPSSSCDFFDEQIAQFRIDTWINNKGIYFLLLTFLLLIVDVTFNNSCLLSVWSQICQSCLGRCAPLDCSSLDCPITYRRHQSSQKHKQRAFISQLLNDFGSPVSKWMDLLLCIKIKAVISLVYLQFLVSYWSKSI